MIGNLVRELTSKEPHRSCNSFGYFPGWASG
jgi:hypothetical protein